MAPGLFLARLIAHRREPRARRYQGQSLHVSPRSRWRSCDWYLQPFDRPFALQRARTEGLRVSLFELSDHFSFMEYASWEESSAWVLGRAWDGLRHMLVGGPWPWGQ